MSENYTHKILKLKMFFTYDFRVIRHVVIWITLTQCRKLLGHTSGQRVASAELWFSDIVPVAGTSVTPQLRAHMGPVFLGSPPPGSPSSGSPPPEDPSSVPKPRVQSQEVLALETGMF